MSGSNRRTRARITKLHWVPSLPAARHINNNHGNVTKTMKTQRQRPLRCTSTASLTPQLHSRSRAARDRMLMRQPRAGILG
ncbi:hypothetical protein I79_003612 [Cricetulus griseus]|uniref:Uncharacterized protein n=1 Tax=Cricetulus griseus TaxID=10029 RepID=G3H0F7_CRIGR|nr:hypothetical protein I79_003612 [Cricetulus griseus]